jgi:hypothetical protein
MNFLPNLNVFDGINRMGMATIDTITGNLPPGASNLMEGVGFTLIGVKVAMAPFRQMIFAQTNPFASGAPKILLSMPTNSGPVLLLGGGMIAIGLIHVCRGFSLLLAQTPVGADQAGDRLF